MLSPAKPPSELVAPRLVALGAAVVVGSSLAAGVISTPLVETLGVWTAPLQAGVILGISLPLLRKWIVRPAARSLEEQSQQLQVTLDREQALQEALRQSEAKYRTMVEHVPAVTYLAAPDPEEGFLYISPQVTRLLGYDQEDFYFRRQLWWERVHPEDLERVLSARAACLEHGTPLRIEYRVWTSEGRTVWLREEAVLARDEQGEASSLQGVLLDVTEAKSAEETLREREDQLRHSQKMEAMGRLASGVAHDFNNMLAVINGYSEMLLMTEGCQDPMVRMQLEEISRAGDRAAGLTRQLLAFSRTQGMNQQLVDVNGVAEGARSMLARLIGEDIFFEVELQPELPAVKSDPVQMEQVLMNLSVNARDAMPYGGTLRIRTRLITVTEANQRDYAHAPVGDYVEISVTDTGCGMDESVRSRIFEPFFTTKEEGKGTGLGLATVYGIVRRSQGHMTVDSAPGLGTTFRIYLPASREQVGAAEGKANGSGSGHGSETILLVEDEEMVRNLITTFLGQRGYRMVPADSAESALQVLEGLREPVDLVLTDVVMPGISGPEMIQWMRRRHPDLRVLYMSGYTNDLLAERGIDATREDFIQKPFAPEQLAARVRALLDKESTVETTLGVGR